MTIGKKITSLRAARNLSQIELSAILGIKNNTLSQYESGTRSVPDDIKIKIAEYFDVSLDFLMGHSNAKKASSAEDACLSDDEDALLSDFRKLTEDQKAFVLQAVKAEAIRRAGEQK